MFFYWINLPARSGKLGRIQAQQGVDLPAQPWPQGWVRWVSGKVAAWRSGCDLSVQEAGRSLGGVGSHLLLFVQAPLTSLMRVFEKFSPVSCTGCVSLGAICRGAPLSGCWFSLSTMIFADLLMSKDSYQWFPNLAKYQKHVGSLLKIHRFLESSSGDSGLIGLGWSLRIWTFKKPQSVLTVIQVWKLWIQRQFCSQWGPLLLWRFWLSFSVHWPFLSIVGSPWPYTVSFALVEPGEDVA